MEAAEKTQKEYIPILKYVMILSEKGIPTSLDSISSLMAIGKIDAKRQNGQWCIAKSEMVNRIRARGKKIEPIEAGFYSIQGFVFHLNEYGVYMSEDKISHQISSGLLKAKQDHLGRTVIPERELKKKIEQFSPQRVSN